MRQNSLACRNQHSGDVSIKIRNSSKLDLAHIALIFRQLIPPPKRTASRILLGGCIVMLQLICCAGPSPNKRPTVVKGVIDLRGWDFETDGSIRLQGQWRLCGNDSVGQSYGSEPCRPDSFVTIMLSETNGDRPLCGIYFNLHTPHKKKAA